MEHKEQRQRDKNVYKKLEKSLQSIVLNDHYCFLALLIQHIFRVSITQQSHTYKKDPSGEKMTIKFPNI